MLTKCRSFRRASLLSVLIGAALSFFSLTAVAQSSQSGTDEKAASTTASTPEQDNLRLLSTKRYPGRVYVLPATMETTQWGWFNNAQPPVLHVDSGDTIMFETMMHSHNQVVPGDDHREDQEAAHRFPGRGPHTLTGPVYIEGAEPGDVLKVRINKIVPRAYGTNFNVPGMFGQFPGKFPDGQVKYFYLDLERKSRRVRARASRFRLRLSRHARRRARRAGPIQLRAAGTLRGQYRCREI